MTDVNIDSSHANDTEVICDKCGYELLQWQLADHVRDVCPQCTLCHEQGHAVQDCPSIDEELAMELTCENCAEIHHSVEMRGHWMRECLPCWRETLRHGHAHGLHNDGEADPRSEDLDECPECPAVHVRIARAEAARKAREGDE